MMNTNRIEDAYTRYASSMLGYAQSRLDNNAEDVVHDAFMEVMALPELPDGDIEGLLIQRLKWRIADALRVSAEVLETELGTVDEDGQERPMDLTDLEEAQSHHGSIPPWPSAVDYDSPEELMTAAQMRDKIREYALEYCGERAYAVFLAVVVDARPQEHVARQFHMDQATISRTVNFVRSVLREQLAIDGYSVEDR